MTPRQKISRGQSRTQSRTSSAMQCTIERQHSVRFTIPTCQNSNDIEADMKPDLFNELRKLRNEIAHGMASADPVALANRLSALGLSIPAAELPKLIPAILKVFGDRSGIYYVPHLLVQVLSKILEGRSATAACDPWAGIGAVLAAAQEAVHATKALAFTQNEAEAALGRVLVPSADWQVGEPIELLKSLNTDLDVIVSVLPFGAKSNHPLTLLAPDGQSIDLQDDLGNLILAASTARLGPGGIGLFVVPASFFFSQSSVTREFAGLGFGVEAALALPPGAFAPYANISTYLAVVRKQPFARMFVAQFSSDANTNLQIISNLTEGKEGGTLELGRFVDPIAFTGLDSIRTAERFRATERKFGAPSLPLEELATGVDLGRYGKDFKFPPRDNAIFIPMIGISNVVDSLDDLGLKPQNYAQVAIDPAKSNARFVARYLNSEIGKEIRESSKSGVIPKLNKQTLKNLRIFIPDLQTQKVMLDIEARIATQQNTLLGLQNELGELRRELWSNPKSAPEVDHRLTAVSSRLSGSLKQHAIAGLDEWFETLPFPLASILRAWQATPSQDFKTKYEHLLHFFEGTAEFLSIILLSAFSSNEALFESHKQKLTESMRGQNLSFRRATFGTWKVVVEYLGKQTRQLLSENGKKADDAKNDRAVCAAIFSDPSLALPKALGRKELAGIISTTNKMRNDWGGHGGVVGQEEAQLRNEQLFSEVQKLREVIADTWAETQLIRALLCRPRGGVFENEVALLMGSNSEFLKETRPMATWLDVDRLYLSRKDSGQALRLLPLVQVGPSPQSAKNACYFFSRLERDGARFVSYHFTDKPELTGHFDEATAAIKDLTEI